MVRALNVIHSYRNSSIKVKVFFCALKEQFFLSEYIDDRNWCHLT